MNDDIPGKRLCGNNLSQIGHANISGSMRGGIHGGISNTAARSVLTDKPGMTKKDQPVLRKKVNVISFSNYDN